MRSKNINLQGVFLRSLLNDLEDKSFKSQIKNFKNSNCVTALKPETSKVSKRLGCMKGEIQIMEDFDTWPDDIAISLGIKD